MTLPVNPRKQLAAKLAEIEAEFPAEDLRGGDYGRLNRHQQAEMRDRKAQAIAAARAECDRQTEAVAAAQRRRAANFEIGGGKTTEVDHAAVASVRTLLAGGASPRKLANSLDGEQELLALRWLVETDNLGGNSATEEQAEQLGAKSERNDAQRRLLHQIDRKLYPEWAEEAEKEHVNSEFVDGLASGHDAVTSLQAAQIAGMRLG